MNFIYVLSMLRNSQIRYSYRRFGHRGDWLQDFTTLHCRLFAYRDVMSCERDAMWRHYASGLLKSSPPVSPPRHFSSPRIAFRYIAYISYIRIHETATIAKRPSQHCPSLVPDPVRRPPFYSPPPRVWKRLHPKPLHGPSLTRTN